MQAYRAFAAALAERGVDAVFGVMGYANMYWVSAYAARPDTAWYPAWHEAGALGMADGYAAATGRVGVATVTMGPGLAQSLGALTAAVRTRRRLLVITAEVTENPPAQAQSAEQAAWVRACGARYLRVSAATDLGRALDDALCGELPCVLAVVVDVFDEQVDGLAPPAAAPAPRLELPDLAPAVELLAGARAPVIVLGRGALDALAEVGDLGQRIGAAFVTTVGAKGALSDDPFHLGLTGMMASPLTRAIADEADVVLVVGAALDLYNSDGGHQFAHAALVRIDRKTPLWDPDPSRVLHLTGDAALLVAALATRLPAGQPGLRTEATRARLRTEAQRQRALTATVQSDGPNPWDVMAVLDAGLPDDAYCVIGIGHFWYFAAPYLHRARARRFQFGCGFAMIGQALPLAVGAAAARPGGLVVAFEGDGSLAMNLVELQAAVGFGQDLLVVVLNNQGYGSEYHKLALRGLDARDSEFGAPIDYVAVAQALGATARRARDTTELRAALADLLALDGVRLLDVSIAMSPMSEVYQRQHG